MKSIIISNYVLIREGLYSIISKYNNMHIENASETLQDAIITIKEKNVDIIFMELHEENELELIKEVKECGINSKFIIVDFNENKDLFIKAIRCGVEGYIDGKSNEADILHSIDQIDRGKKYYDTYFIDSMINENNTETQKGSQLTAREKEILCEIGRGMSNRKISEKFYISEHTVKKHINHIFDKLKLSDRTQAALYANRFGITNENAS